ncbi:DUF554 domain-containing protein [Clostridium thermarum]|uniref:DUF554 domain-containing protein n=1 Tax=Clostridium thermarum TaxID=1716543 RepID=UPI0013D58C4A|nr:DUF554 domain-containing protein [Clostridium thermarum]
MLGTIVNFFAVIAGSCIGLLLKGGISERFNHTIMQGISLCVLLIGISGALNFDNMLVVIICICIGALIGEAIDMDKRLVNLGDSLERRFKNSKSKISEGFVTASLLYCVGAMAIVGAIQSGLQGNHETLFSKSILDGISSIFFSSTLGIGVALSSVSVLFYQGAITLCAGFLDPILTDAIKMNMEAVGSLIIIGLGLNMLGVTKIKVANLLPAIFLPILAPYIINLFKLFIH